MGLILWLEDDEYFMRKIMRPLEDQGYEIKMYTTAADFLKDLNLISKSNLVVIDLLVPSGPGLPNERYAGLGVLKAISNLPTTVPLLVLSVVAESDTLRDVRKYTPHILTKPVRLEKFIKLALNLLGHANGRDLSD
jgi:DNA-binding NtrC family response regulator